MIVEGDVAAGWEPVADTLRRSLADGRDLGAAVAVYVNGAPVVDIWGGWADGRTRRPWRQGTTACVFSTTKGITALCAHLLVERGLLDLDAPVAEYWPEFAQAGKAQLPVRYLLTHQAGLAVLDDDLSLGDVRAMTPVLRAIERQHPAWEPGTHIGYHAVTFGFLVGEVVRRVSGVRLGDFFTSEVARPLGLNAWIGLPETVDTDLAHLEPLPLDAGMQSALLKAEPGTPLERMRRAITLGSALPLGLVTGDPGDFNDRGVLAAELGGSGMVTDARSLARTYAAAVSEVDGYRLLTDEAAAACIPMRTTASPVFGAPPADIEAPRALDFGLGFICGDKLGPSSFGHPGAGGSLAFGDLDARLGFAYVPNRMAGDGDTRAADLVEDVRQAVG
jgi:CubicO group peptidase (beta-lactamase class C family)